MNSKSPKSSKCVNGHTRGKNATENDFDVYGKRCEIKSSQFVFNNSRNGWNLAFSNVKSDCHDILLPRCIYTFWIICS